MNGSKLKILTLSLALGGALVGCEGMVYDATTGRIVPAAEASRAAKAADSTARPQQDPAQAAAPADPSAYAAQGSSGAGSASAAPSSGSSGAAGDSAPPPSFDSFSRTPPAPILQADGTPLKPVIARVSPDHGTAAGGEEVVIAGTGFANVQVLFNGSPARVTSQSSNAVTVVVPEGDSGRVVSLVVTNRDGTYTVAPQAYAYR